MAQAGFPEEQDRVRLVGRRFIKSVLGAIIYVRGREGKEKGKELVEGETEL